MGRGMHGAPTQFQQTAAAPTNPQTAALDAMFQRAPVYGARYAMPAGMTMQQQRYATQDYRQCLLFCQFICVEMASSFFHFFRFLVWFCSFFSPVLLIFLSTRFLFMSCLYFEFSLAVSPRVLRPSQIY